MQGAAPPGNLDARQAPVADRRPAAPRSAHPTKSSPSRGPDQSPRGAGRDRLASSSGALHDTKGAVWQITAIDTDSSYAWTDLVRCQTGQPTTEHTIALVRRSPPNSPTLTGSCSARAQTTATSFAPAWRSAPPLTRSASATPHARPTDTRTAAERDPQGMLATCLRPLSLPTLHGPQAPPRQLPDLLQPPPRTHRPNHQPTLPHRTRLRCPQR